MTETTQQLSGTQESNASINKKDAILEQPDQQAQDDDDRLGFFASARAIFSWKNYTVYLLTAWVFNACSSVGSYYNLYLRSLGWDYILVGAVISMYSLLVVVTRFLGGYVGDVIDRKKLATTAMFLMSMYYLVMGLFEDLTMIVVALAILASMDLAKSGASAFLMDNIPREHGGLALSFFNVGRSLGIITLMVFGMIVPVIGFSQAFRTMYFATGILLLVCTGIRALLMDSGHQEQRTRNQHVLKDFLSENARTIKLLFTTIPGIILIMFLDGLSDSIFKFGALIYTNETVGIDIAGINIILLTVMIISIPLLLKVGRFADRTGVRRASLVIYSVMPICAGVLFLASIFQYWLPLSIVEELNSILPGMGVLFSLPFIGIVMKNVNDTLWWLVLMTLIRKKLPRKDTSKILAMLMTVTYIVHVVGPVVGGFIFSSFEQSTLFLVILSLNLLILGVIAKTVQDEGRIDSNET